MSSAARSGGPPPKRPSPRPSSLPRGLGLSTFHKCGRPKAQSEGVAVLGQRIRGVAVPADLPVPELFFVRERDGAHPLRALVRVSLRHEESHRPAVLDRQGFPVPLVCEEDVCIIQNIERVGRRVAIAAPERREAGRRANLRAFGDLLHRDPDPFVVESGPAGHAVKGRNHFDRRKSQELVVRETDRLLDRTVYTEVPLLCVKPPNDSQNEPGPFPNLSLSGRETPVHGHCPETIEIPRYKSLCKWCDQDYSPRHRGA